MNSPSVDRAALRGLFEKYFEGRKERLLEFLLIFYTEMARDVLIGFFFREKNLQAIASKQADFLWKAAGISATYTGQAPGTAHLGLAPILDGHFNRRLRLLESNLRRIGATPEEIAIWIAFENAFRGAIVGH